MIDDEVGKDLIGLRERRSTRVRRELKRPVKREQKLADEEESDELHEDHHAGDEQGDRRFSRAGRAQVSLHHVLIGAVRAHVEKTSTDYTRPEDVRPREVE